MKRDEQKQIEASAAAWLGRRDGGFHSAELAEFERWCSADPRHAKAVAETEAAWSSLDRPLSVGLTGMIHLELKHRARRRRNKARMAAAGLAFCAICALVVEYAGSRAASTTTSVTTARVVSPERRILPDGSVVELRPGSRIDVEFGGGFRRVKLVQGEARFEVAKDKAHPFLVDANSVEARAVGTAFSVSLDPGEIEVLVTEGHVSVSRTASGSHSTPVSLGAGNRIVVPTGVVAGQLPGWTRLDDSEIGEHLAWTIPRLEFTDTSIAEAASLFNRGNLLQLKLGDAEVARLRVNGVFREDNVEGFVRLLESGFHIRAERVGDRLIVLHGVE